jgi:hypothetical protein
VTLKFWEMLKNASEVTLVPKNVFFLKSLNLVQSFVECKVSLADGSSTFCCSESASQCQVEAELMLIYLKVKSICPQHRQFIALHVTKRPPAPQTTFIFRFPCHSMKQVLLANCNKYEVASHTFLLSGKTLHPFEILPCPNSNIFQRTFVFEISNL